MSGMTSPKLPTRDEAGMRWLDHWAILMGYLLGDRVESAVDQAHHRSQLRRALGELPAGRNDGGWEVLARACSRTGARLTRIDVTVEDALELSDDDRMLLVHAPERDGCPWLLLAGRHGRKARILEADPTAEPACIRESKVLIPDLMSWIGDPEGPRFATIAPVDPFSVHHGHDKGVAMSPFRRLIHMMRPERRDIRLILVFAVATGLLNLATPIAVEALVNSVAFGGLLQPVIVLALVLAGCLGIAATLRALSAWIVELLQRRVFVRLVSDLSWRLPHVSLEHLDGHHGPELVNRFFDILTIQKVAAKLLLDGVQVLLSAMIGLIVLAFYHPLLLAFDLLLVVSLLIIVFLLGRGGVRTSLKESSAKYAVVNWLEELARHPYAFRLTGADEIAWTEGDRLASDYVKRRSEHFTIVIRQLIASLMLQVVASTVLLGLGGWLVKVNQLTLGQLVASWLIVSVIVSSVTKLSSQLEAWYDLLTGVAKVGKLVDLPLERADGERPADASKPAGLELVNLDISFPGRPTLLSGASYKIEPGESVALRAPSGSGKSVLLDMIYGLRSPSEGRILVDGVDQRDLELRALRERVALARGSMVVSGSIVDNVRMGREEMGLSEIRNALEAVELLQEIQQLPDGLRTLLTTDGRPLSSGQCERLVLARALAGHPRLLMVDGQLDSLGPDMRRRIAERLCAEGSPWTLILVSSCPELQELCTRRIDWVDIKETSDE